MTSEPEVTKRCCADLYASDWVQALLGDSLHPGGLTLTERLGELLGLTPGMRVLDVAAGRGTTAIHLARRFGCRVVGVDYSARNVALASDAAAAARLAGLLRFVEGDAEHLEFEDGAFDAVVCECAFCTFPDKAAAAREFARVLAPDGRTGLSDLTRSGPLPDDLSDLLAWIACIADALPVDDYSAHLERAGIRVMVVEPHDGALVELVERIRVQLLGAELLKGLNRLDLPGVDFARARRLARAATGAIRAGRLGYALLAGTKRADGSQSGAR